MYESIKVAVYIDYIYMYFVKSSSYQGRHVTWVSDDLLKKISDKVLNFPAIPEINAMIFFKSESTEGY